jgi:hypothetical protein
VYRDLVVLVDYQNLNQNCGGTLTLVALCFSLDAVCIVKNHMIKPDFAKYLLVLLNMADLQYIQPGNSLNRSRHKSPKTLDSGTSFSQCVWYVLQSSSSTCSDFQIYA